MKDEQDQFFQEPEELEDLVPIKEQHQALPPKSYQQTQKKPQLKRVQIPREQAFLLYRPFKISKKIPSDEQQQDTNGLRCDSPFTEFYSNQQCVYMRHNNRSFNKYQGKYYYSGQFANRNIFTDCQSNNTSEISQILNEYYDIPQPKLQPLQPNDLIFDSRFQSGNLFAAFKVSQYEYDLSMSNDTNSYGSNQWFYFSVQGMKPHKQYTFAVINFTKTDALFNYGMKPAVYSMVENKNVKDNEKGWRRAGTQVSYKRGKLPRQYSNRFYYRLSFKIKAYFDKDKLFIAHSYPYTFDKMHKFVLEKKQKNKQFVTKMQIGKTLSKRPIQVLCISYPINKKRDNRKAIIIMARQHPGQTQGSYVCQGVIDKLLSRTKQSEFLLKNYVFYVIPMVNPDGVIFGHYRTNLAGKDLNRKWNASEKDLNCPEVLAVKGFLSQLSQTRDIRFILDLHGHSRKLNSFFYGNPCQQSPQAVRIFPFICSKLHPGIQYYDCTFTTEQCKRKAARVYLYFSYKLIHVYTFQSSFYAFEKEGKTIEFTPKQYRQLGHTLISTLHLQLQHEVKFQQSFEFNLKKNVGKQYINSTFVKYLMELKNNKFLLEQGTAFQSGSDSKPEDGQINNEQLSYNKPSRGLISSFPRQSITKSIKTRNKGPQIKEQLPINRPTRHLRLLQLSKINSFLPDKELFCLQPIRKKQPESAPKIQHFKTSIQCQTEPFQQEKAITEFEYADIENANLSFSFASEANIDKKANSMVKSLHMKNNIIFKMDYSSNKTQRDHYHQQTQLKKKKPNHKNALSQTILSIKFRKQRKKEVIQQKQIVEKQQAEPFWLKSAQIKIQAPLSSIVIKKDAESYFNNMIKRFLDKKQKSMSYQAASRSALEKSFTIKRRESNKR